LSLAGRGGEGKADLAQRAPGKKVLAINLH